MKNKLGITNEEDLKEIELKITNLKYELINENFTFEEETIFSIDFLEKIHIFLFNDIYDIEYCKIKESIDNRTRKRINLILKKFQMLYLNFEVNKLSKLIYHLWKEQIFYDGNTRTILAFLKIYNNGFMLNLNYDFNKYITEDFFIEEIIDAILTNKKSKKY